MPAANKTDNIELNQWLGNEYPKREDFNADNLKIDTAITGTNNDLAAHLADKAQHISGNDAVAVRHSASQSIANNTWTTLAWDTEDFDTNSLHDNSTNNSRLTCKTAGKYLIIGYVAFDINNTGVREAGVVINGAGQGIQSGAAFNGDNVGLTVSTVCQMAVNDYAEVAVLQTSGGALNVTAGSRFKMIKVG